jgi:hypothetical protein
MRSTVNAQAAGSPVVSTANRRLWLEAPHFRSEEIDANGNWILTREPRQDEFENKF